MRKKKGYTLIELMVVLGISSLIFALSSRILFNEVQDYRKSIQEEHNFSVREAATYIQEQSVQIPSSVKVENNKLYYDSYVSSNKYQIKAKMIFLDEYNKSLYIYDVNSSVKSKFASEISEFKVEKKDEVVYLTMKTQGGKSINKCFALKNM